MYFLNHLFPWSVPSHISSSLCFPVRTSACLISFTSPLFPVSGFLLFPYRRCFLSGNPIFPQSIPSLIFPSLVSRSPSTPLTPFHHRPSSRSPLSFCLPSFFALVWYHSVLTPDDAVHTRGEGGEADAWGRGEHKAASGEARRGVERARRKKREWN